MDKYEFNLRDTTTYISRYKRLLVYLEGSPSFYIGIGYSSEANSINPSESLEDIKGLIGIRKINKLILVKESSCGSYKINNRLWEEDNTKPTHLYINAFINRDDFNFSFFNIIGIISNPIFNVENNKDIYTSLEVVNPGILHWVAYMTTISRLEITYKLPELNLLIKI
jgi:hypothetical protein